MILQGNLTFLRYLCSFNWLCYSLFKLLSFFFATVSEKILCVGIPRKNENQLAKLAIVTLAAGVLTLGSVHDASAAKTGGRVGGQAFRSSAPRSSPRINNNNSR